MTDVHMQCKEECKTVSGEASTEPTCSCWNGDGSVWKDGAAHAFAGIGSG
ncbi:uncharacterized protein DS421_14g450340 [Arachis hypogaea]|nr:uncharacterized protein DS421_14g450340 [Arachis hypogaea]